MKPTMIFITSQSHISYFFFLPISYKFNDLLFTDSETFKVVIRMFMDFNLINQYQIPYRVSKTCSIHQKQRSIGFIQPFLPSESVPLDPEREEELPSGEVPQLAARAQRRPDHVHRAQDRKDGPLHERLGGEEKGDIAA